MQDIIGIAGYGRMGAGMLANLRTAGFNARGFDVRAMDNATTDIDAFCDGLTTLITVVRDSDETDAVLFNDQAITQRAKTLKTSSSALPSHPTTSKDCARKPPPTSPCPMLPCQARKSKRMRER